MHFHYKDKATNGKGSTSSRVSRAGGAAGGARASSDCAGGGCRDRGGGAMIYHDITVSYNMLYYNIVYL